MWLICQLDFREIGPLPDFPEQGVLQIFSSLEYSDDPITECEYAVRWDENLRTSDNLAVPEEFFSNKPPNRDFSVRTLKEGLPLSFEKETALGNPFNWPFGDVNPIYENRLPENDRVKAILDGWEAKTDAILEANGTHWVGGHPSYTQEDIRFEESYQILNRVIFHLGPDENVNIGDSGELNVMIAQEALVKRDFEKICLTWDCS